jgi:hypothetical protein
VPRKRYALRKRLAAVVVWMLVPDFVLLLEVITVFLEAFKKVKLLGKDLAQNYELIDADKVCAHKIYRLISLPAIAPSLFLNMVGLWKFS